MSLASLEARPARYNDAANGTEDVAGQGAGVDLDVLVVGQRSHVPAPSAAERPRSPAPAAR
jgi:hypothetical protein